MTAHEDQLNQQSLLRRVMVGFVGGVVAGLAGLALSVVVGRAYGAEGAGIFFTVVAYVMVLANIFELGADTGLVWFLPRLRARLRSGDQRRAVVVALVPVIIVSSIAGLVTFGLAPILGPLLSDGGDELVTAGLQWAGIGVVSGSIASVAIAATRGAGGLAIYVALQNVVLPLGRVLGVLAMALAGFGVLAAIAIWNVVWAVVAVIALLAVARIFRSVDPGDPTTDATPASWRSLSGEFWRFTMPRALSATVEVGLVWADVLIVAALLGPTEAGIYAIVSRFITAGTLGNQAVRIALSPRFAQLFARHDLPAVGRLLQAATPVMLALTWPLFLLTALLPADVLLIFGPEFVPGASLLVVLSGAMLIAATWGPVGGALLMSGRSTLQLVNRCVSLAVLVAVDLYLIPKMGLMGAAIGWAISLVIDTTLDGLALLVLDGVRPWDESTLLALALVTLAGAAGPLIARAASWSGLMALIGAGLVTTLATAGLFASTRTPMSLRRFLAET